VDTARGSLCEYCLRAACARSVCTFCSHVFITAKLGRLLSRDKVLNARIDDVTRRLCQILSERNGVKVFAIQVDFLVESPPTASSTASYLSKSTRDDEEEDEFRWTGKPRIWCERVLDIEYDVIPHQVTRIEKRAKKIAKRETEVKAAPPPAPCDKSVGDVLELTSLTSKVRKRERARESPHTLLL